MPARKLQSRIQSEAEPKRQSESTHWRASSSLRYGRIQEISRNAMLGGLCVVEDIGRRCKSWMKDVRVEVEACSLVEALKLRLRSRFNVQVMTSRVTCPKRPLPQCGRFAFRVPCDPPTCLPCSFLRLDDIPHTRHAILNPLAAVHSNVNSGYAKRKTEQPRHYLPTPSLSRGLSKADLTSR